MESIKKEQDNINKKLAQYYKQKELLRQKQIHIIRSGITPYGNIGSELGSIIWDNWPEDLWPKKKG